MTRTWQSSTNSSSKGKSVKSTGENFRITDTANLSAHTLSSVFRSGFDFKHLYSVCKNTDELFSDFTSQEDIGQI